MYLNPVPVLKSTTRSSRPILPVSTSRAIAAHDAPPSLRDPAEPLHLVERFPHADQAGPAAGRVDDDVGELPGEVLGELVAHRLLPLDAVRLLQRRDVEPAFGGLPLRDDLPAAID